MSNITYSASYDVYVGYGNTIKEAYTKLSEACTIQDFNLIVFCKNVKIKVDLYEC